MVVDDQVLAVQDNDEIVPVINGRKILLLRLAQREKAGLNLADIDFDLLGRDGFYFSQDGAIVLE